MPQTAIVIRFESNSLPEQDALQRLAGDIAASHFVVRAIRRSTALRSVNLKPTTFTAHREHNPNARVFPQEWPMSVHVRTELGDPAT